MRIDDSGPISIFRIEPTDERQAIFQELHTRCGQKDGVVLVLPNEAIRAFQSPKDFHELKIVKRHWDLQLVLVIPKQGQAQWARSNNFTVYPSWEDLVKAISGKKNRDSGTGTKLATYQEHSEVMYPQPPTPLTQIPFHQEEQQPDLFPPSIMANGHAPSRVPNPVTPVPTISAEFLAEAGSQISASQPLHTKQEPYSLSQPLHTELERSLSQPLHASLAPPISTPAAPPTYGQQKGQPRRQMWLYIVLTIVLISAVGSAGLLIAQRGTAPSTNSPANVTAPTLTGHLYFQSSGQINEMGTTGINDVVELTLSNLPAHKPGKSYYAWLRSDANRSDGPVIMLGQLQVSQGKAALTYRDAQHTDLLTIMSQFLVTEEDATIQPAVPSPDSANWRYSGIIPQTPNPADTQDHFSYLDHLRHLLAADPTLEKLGLHGGLSFWLDKNTKKVGEWASAAQDEQDPNLIHRHMLRILDYLDGVDNVAGDVPAGSPILVDQTQGKVGLLQIHAGQNPEGYLQHIGFHLNSLVSSPGADQSQQVLAQQLVIAMNNVNTWLGKARQDAQQLVVLSNEQLTQPPAKALLNDLATQVNIAYVGTTDPTTGNVQHGVSWIRTTMQNMAVINIFPYKPL